MKNWLSRLTLLACTWALVVIMLGAYVRLSDAGLGCPDWPGCYGHIGVPDTQEELAAANANYDRPVEAEKAWKEMIHRYLASGLGLIILLIAFMSWKCKKAGERAGFPLAMALVVLVVFQGLLGMWTVTLLVKPIIVTAHLMFGLMTFCVLWWLFLHLRADVPKQAVLSGAIALGLILLVFQIALGGWVSTNYAAVACQAFPGCYVGQFWPEMNFAEGFVLWRGLGIDYEFGVLDSPARVAIHMTHRIGALVVFVYWAWLLSAIMGRGNAAMQRIAMIFAGVLVVQIGLGISNVIFHLPISIAVAHNGVAALLLVVTITLWHASRRVETSPA